MALRIEIDVDECMSSGKCVADFSTAFGFNDDELAELLPRATDLSDEHKLRAARNCPSRALALFDADDAEVPT